ncbi:MAG: cellulase family glycosylhydrolase [Spirochaetales bacterium]|nr:cellulase family glycosylhydrolase [Spirochaetales bacterium]
MKKYTRFLKMQKKAFIFFIFFIYALSALYTESPDIKRLTGVNWFGFETGDAVPHGLWARDYKSMLRQIKDLEFNCVRIPWANETLNKSPRNITISEWVNDPYTGQHGINLDLAGKSSLEVMDKIIEEAGRLDLRIILDCHSRALDNYRDETLWYTEQWPESRWISDWVFITERYLNNPAVVAFDINNEPHGGLYGMGMKPPASWGYDVPDYGDTNWKAAAERCASAIRQVNPDIIIIVQGVQESSDGSNYWWGSNHKDLKTYPLTGVPASRLMFSVHEYGPSVAPQTWFEDPAFPDNLDDVWRDRFWFIYEEDIAGLYIGEMGLKEEEAQNPSCIAYKWFTRWLSFAGDKVHWTYWCWNPNSGDTGGILKDDWVKVNEVKYNLIKPYLEPWSPGTSTPGPLPTPSPTPSPTPTQFPPPTLTPTPSGGIILQASFTSSAEGFVYSDDTFRGTNNPDYASGSYDSYGGISGGGLRVYLGGAETGGPVSGGWSRSFNASGDIVISLDYRMVLGRGAEPDEFAEAIVVLDDEYYVLDSLYGDGDGGINMDTGWHPGVVLAATGSGSHMIIIGAYNNNSSHTDEWVDFFIDNVRIETGPPITATPTIMPTPPPNTPTSTPVLILGDVDSNGMVDIVDALLVAQYYVGLNPVSFNPEAADVNCDSMIDIVDALLIAQYYVGLLPGFC